MSKPELKLKARKMRNEGLSIKQITKFLGVSKSSVSLWCEDIILSSAQVEKLNQNRIRGGYEGRMKGARLNREKKERKIKDYEKKGLVTIGKLSKRDILLLGLGLYMGEGGKTNSKVVFVNSNFLIIKVFIKFIENVFFIPKSDIGCRVMINEIHKKRDQIVKIKWSRILKIPIDQFSRTTFIKSKTKKIYENYNDYLGTLHITIRRSSDLQYRILGLIKALMYKT
jgi:predicted transcriptional regulator